MVNTIIQAVVSVLVPGIILALLTKKLSQKGPKLVYYVSAATWFTNIQPAQPNGQQQQLHVVTIAIRNNGNEVAKSVDISHFRWPMHFQIVPFISNHIINDSSGQPRVIRLDSLNPGETVWISYVFNSLVDTDVFIEYVRSEEVKGSQTRMLLNPMFSPRLAKILVVLFIFGLIFIGLAIWWLYPPIASGIQWLLKFPR
jgi:hypothetical protein